MASEVSSFHFYNFCCRQVLPVYSVVSGFGRPARSNVRFKTEPRTRTYHTTYHIRPSRVHMVHAIPESPARCAARRPRKPRVKKLRHESYREPPRSQKRRTRRNADADAPVSVAERDLHNKRLSTLNHATNYTFHQASNQLFLPFHSALS
jgi:hypothetical protein